MQQSRQDQRFTLEQLVRAGQDASAALQNPILNHALMQINERLMAEFYNTPPGHSKTLEEIRRRGNAMAEFLMELEREITVSRQILSEQQPGGNS